MKLRCCLMLLFVTLLWKNFSQAGSIRDAETKLIQNSLNDINRINQNNESCDDPQCKFLNDLTKEDSLKILTGVLLKNQICDEQMLRETVDDGSNSANSFAKAYSGIGDFAVTQAGRCSKGDQWEQRRNLSKYYYFADRIYETEKINLMQMAMNDRILGKNLLDGVDCGIFSFETNRKQCESLRNSCQPKPKLDKLAEETAEVETELQDIREEVQKLDSTMDTKKGLLAEIRKYNHFEKAMPERLESEIATLREQIAQRQALISLRIQKYPWVIGQKYKELKPAKLDWPASADQVSKMKAAITQQLEVDRDGMIKKENSLSEDVKCLNGLSECSTSDFLEKAQKLETFAPSENKSVNGLMQAQACYTATKTEQLKSAKAVRHTVVDAGLMFAGSIGIWSKVFRGSSLLIRGVQLSAEGAVTASTFGAAAYYTSKAVPQAIAACSNRKEAVRKKSKVLETDFSKVCDDNSQVDYEETFDDYASCMQKTIFAAMDALPLAIGAKSLQSTLRKFREGRSEEQVTAYQVGRMQQVVGSQQQDLEKVRALNKALKKYAIADKKRKGIPSDKVYLNLSDKMRLKNYTIKGKGGEPDKVTMRVEEVEVLGVYDIGSLETVKKNFGQKNLIIEEIAGVPGKFKVSHWAAGSGVPVDPLTNVIAATKRFPEGRKILEKVVNNCSTDPNCKKTLIFIDVNNLGVANYFHHGSGGADLYLQQAILEAQKNIRAANKDRPSTDPIFGIGGDEFVVVVDARNAQDAAKIAQRIEESVKNNPQIKQFFTDQSDRFLTFKNKLGSAQSWEDIGTRVEVLDFVRSSKTWQALSSEDKRDVFTQPEKFQSFISKFLSSPEMVLKQTKLDSLQPGVTVGTAQIKPDESYTSILGVADREMQLRKNKIKNEERKDLPSNDKSIDKDDVAIPNWGD